MGGGASCRGGNLGILFFESVSISSISTVSGNLASSTLLHAREQCSVANDSDTEFKEEDPFLIARMLMYCYMLSWPEFKMDDSMNGVWKEEKQWVSCLDTIVKMYALGDKFDIKGLKLATRLDEDNFWLYGEFIAVIPLIYTTTPDTDRGLRDQAVDYGSVNWKSLWAQPGFKDKLTETGDFINDIVTKLGERS